MIIANPIYDTVFKYLLEDLGIAKDLLAMILNVEITELAVKPQETTVESYLESKLPISIYRLDFVAIIKENNGAFKKVLIELQKSKKSTNILRFRRYLAENYQKEDKIIIENKEVLQSLEIVTLYFLGFELDDVPTSIMKVKNCFVDVTTGENLSAEPKDKFVRLLNHESYMVQIPKLKPNEKSRVENVLSIFSQDYVTDYDDQKLNYDEKISSDPLSKRIVNRLTRAIADDDLRRKMNIEEEFERDMQEIEETKQVLRVEIVQQKVEIMQHKEEIAQQEEEIVQHKEEIVQQKVEIMQKGKEIEQKDITLEQQEKALEIGRASCRERV